MHLYYDTYQSIRLKLNAGQGEYPGILHQHFPDPTVLLKLGQAWEGRTTHSVNVVESHLHFPLSVDSEEGRGDPLQGTGVQHLFPGIVHHVYNVARHNKQVVHKCMHHRYNDNNYFEFQNSITHFIIA